MGHVTHLRFATTRFLITIAASIAMALGLTGCSASQPAPTVVPTAPPSSSEILAQKYGVDASRVISVEQLSGERIIWRDRQPVIVAGCATGDVDYGVSTDIYFFSHDGEVENFRMAGTRIVGVIGFDSNRPPRRQECLAMATTYERSDSFCFAKQLGVSRVPSSAMWCLGGVVQSTFLFRLVDENAASEISISEWRERFGHPSAP